MAFIGDTGRLAPYIGREPIYDRSLEVIGYELQFCGSPSAHAIAIDDDGLGRVLINACSNERVQDLAGGLPAFINVTGNFILRRNPLPFAHGNAALAISENTGVDAAVIETIRALSGQGFKILLDGPVSDRAVLPLLELADMVRIDTRQHSAAQLEELVSRLSPPRAKILAANLYTHDAFAFLRDLGFDCFQGCFLSRPRIAADPVFPGGHLDLLQLLSAIHAQECDFEELVEIIGNDDILGQKLLKNMNCACCDFPGNVDSVQQAAVLLGMKRLRNWATLLALSSLADKPAKLVITATCRAKMCERLATLWRQRDPDVFFTVGLFSLLDSLTDAPLEALLPLLPLTEEVVAALLNHEGPAGAALALAIACERGDLDTVSRTDLRPDAIRDAYLTSLTWANEFYACVTP